MLIERDLGVTTIRFNRPEKRNAMTQMHREMYQALCVLEFDADTRVLVLPGAGESSRVSAFNPLPYVYALVECDPAEVSIGMPVEVVFQDVQPEDGEPFTSANFRAVRR